MENEKLERRYRAAMKVLILVAVGGIAMTSGLLWSQLAFSKSSDGAGKKTRTIYPEKTELDFEGAAIEGELRNPGDFYFQHKPEEKFDSLVKRRKNFHREMRRDAVFAK